MALINKLTNIQHIDSLKFIFNPQPLYYLNQQAF